MKKYRVTDKHEIFKEGIFIDKKTDSLLANSEIYFGSYPIRKWLRLGWIEEIEEKEYTKSDIIDILVEYDTGFVMMSKACDFNELIDKCLKQRNETSC